MENEVWKDVPGYEGWYEVSNFGNVRSVDREIEQCSRYGHTVIRKIKGHQITPTDNGYGYKIVGLTQNNDRHNHYVHKLVAEAFIPNPDMKKEINHKDFDKANNRVGNLEWATRLENIHHSVPNMCKPKPGSRLPRTGEKYIHIKKGRYRLNICGMIDRSYKTLSEALIVREAIIGW